MRKVWLVLAVVGLVGGCSRAPNNSSKLRIGLVPMGTTDPYWQAIHAGASQEALLLNVDVLWPTAFPVGDVNRQLAAIDELHRRGAAAMAIAPVNDAKLHERIATLVRNNIRVVIIDTPLSEGNLPFIGSDNYAAGRAAGEHMTRVLGGRGGVVVMHTRPGAVSVTARVQGFLAVMAEHPGMTVISETAVGAGLEDAFVASHEVLDTSGAREPGRVAGVFTPTQTTTVGMVRALQNLRLTNKIVHVGFDTSPLLANLLRRRALDSLVVQDPNGMGRLSVVTLRRLLTGETAEPRTVTRTVLATPDNANELDILALLKPNLTILR